MSTLMPPKEIIKNIRIHNGFVYLIGDVTEEQKKIFREFKNMQMKTGEKVELKQSQMILLRKKQDENFNRSRDYDYC